jgi:23S rRNA (cytosine1962-C5)-methyltransferase
MNGAPNLLDLLEAAIEKRGRILTGGTDCARLVDGSGDGLDGVILETYASYWLLSTVTHHIEPELLGWLRERGVSCYWKRLDTQQMAAPVLLCGPEVSTPFLVREHGVSYEISFQAGYSQGLFLDQRDNRAEVRRLMRPGQRLLNTFAYTGGFSVAAAMAGAETTTLDLSQPSLHWAKRNFTHNHIDPATHHFCKGDTFHWLRRFAKQGRTFDAIVLDPPTFSRDENGKVFRVEENFGELAQLAAAILEPNGWLLCCTNFRQVAAPDFERKLLESLPHAMQSRQSRMPEDFTSDPYLKSVWLRQGSEKFEYPSS